MSASRVGWIVLVAIIVTTHAVSPAVADGKIVRPRNYDGSLEEKAQEAIVVFTAGDAGKSAVEQLILKIQVEGDVDQFAWVVPLPAEPKVEEADAKLFRELFNYVQTMRVRSYGSKSAGKDAAKDGPTNDGSSKLDVEVLSREIVGSFDVAVVKENTAGMLNTWLTDNGYQALEDSDDIISFYREKGYVFACMRVSDVAHKEAGAAKPFDLHPLSFTFETGGRDGIFFPMRMTGLQTEPFDVNLYVFFRYWLNDDINQFGYVHRDFRLTHRDWDTAKCVANGGKSWDEPEQDPLLSRAAHRIPTIKQFFKDKYEGRRFYLTNIKARSMKPGDVRAWKDDLWLFPYYTNAKKVPDDAHSNGPASAAWQGQFTSLSNSAVEGNAGSSVLFIALGLGFIALVVCAVMATRRTS